MKRLVRVAAQRQEWLAGIVRSLLSERQKAQARDEGRRADRDRDQGPFCFPLEVALSHDSAFDVMAPGQLNKWWLVPQLSAI